VERLHVIAALPPEGLTLAMARNVLDVAGDTSPEVIDAAYRAAANLPAKLADGLVADVRWRCEQGENVENFLPYLVKTSPAGDQHLLAVASGLDAEACENICTWLATRGSSGLRERVRAALDGEIPLEPHLLSRARHHLDRPERVQRVVARLVHGGAEEQVKAFDVLVRAGVYDPSMLEYAITGTSVSVRQLTGLPAGRLPDAAILALLDSDLTSDVVYACQAAAGRTLGREVEGEVRELAQGRYPHEVRVAATMAMMLAGSAEGVRGLWGRLGRTPELQIDAVQWLGERGGPQVRELLQEALAEARLGDAAEGAPQPRGPRREDGLVDALRMALARLGDRRVFDDLIASAWERSARYLRQCRSFAVEAMGMEHVAQIVEGLRGSDVPEPVRIELVSWLGMRPDLEVQQALEGLVASDPSEWVRMEAWRGLLAGPRRVALTAELFQAMGRPLDDRLGDLAYEVVGSGRPPLTEKDMELMARLVLQSPLTRPEEEVRMDLTFYSPRAGFPMLGLVIQQLRHDPGAGPGAVFAAVVDEVLREEDVGLLSRRRCLSFLLQSCVDPRVRDGVGPPVARLLLAIPEGQGHGLAHWLLGEQAEAEGDYQRASVHFAQAARALLRDPDPLRVVRPFLGDRDAVRAVDPLAALAARGPILAARVALERGDRPRAARELTVAAEMAVGDHETAREVLRLQTELNR
jgi:hypothetical protein